MSSVSAVYPSNSAINAPAEIGKVFPDLITETFSQRARRQADIETGRYPVFYELSDPARLEIAAAIKAARRKNIRLDIIEPEDFRVPSFARDVPEIRRRLDISPGFAVLRGIDVSAYSRDENAMIYWGLSNYVGRAMRQNLRGERLDSVQDQGDKVSDPYSFVK